MDSTPPDSVHTMEDMDKRLQEIAERVVTMDSTPPPVAVTIAGTTVQATGVEIAMDPLPDRDASIMVTGHPDGLAEMRRLRVAQTLAAGAVVLVATHAPPQQPDHDMRPPPHVIEGRRHEMEIERARKERRLKREARAKREHYGVYTPPEPAPEMVDYVTALRVRRQLNQLKRAAQGAIVASPDLLNNAFPGT